MLIKKPPTLCVGGGRTIKRINYIVILATVITNLLSAIPFIGADIVPFRIISLLW